MAAGTDNGNKYMMYIKIARDILYFINVAAQNRNDRYNLIRSLSVSAIKFKTVISVTQFPP